MSTLATPIRRRRQLKDPGLRESGVRRPEAGAVLQPQRDSLCAPLGRRPVDVRPADVLSTRRAFMPIAAIFSCNWPRCRPRRWSRSRNSNSSACWRRATPSWSGWSTSRPSASTRRTTIRRLSRRAKGCGRSSERWCDLVFVSANNLSTSKTPSETSFPAWCLNHAAALACTVGNASVRGSGPPGT